MEVKKSHKADLEHLRPWMFLFGIVLTLLVFLGALNLRLGMSGSDDDDLFDDMAMDLNLKPNDQRDMIAAAEKTEQKEAEQLNKVDHLTDLAPEEINVVKFQPGEDADNEELKEEEEDEPINLNEEDPETLRIVQELPEYPGGMVEFMKWLTKNLKYPPTALKDKIQGKVMVSFIVNTDGSISDVKVVQNAHRLLETEALRVIRSMPKWKPGMDHGKICRTMIAIPVVFEI